MKKVRLISLLAIVTFTFNSCKQEEKKPDYLLEKERFVEVLTEFQLAESVVRLGYHRSPDSMYFNDSIYQAAFRKMEVTKAEFDSNYQYYLERPKELEEIYEKVISKLSERTAELEKEKETEPTQVDSL